MNQSTNSLAVGAGRAIIDLPAGLMMAGYGRRTGPSVGTLKPLEARAVLFDDSRAASMVVVLDLVYVTAELTRAIAEGIARDHPIDPNHVMVSATHTHCGPMLNGCNSQGWAQAVTAGVEAAAMAFNAARPAHLQGGRVPTPGFGANRRDGRVLIDEGASVVVAISAEEPADVLAVVFEMACHATVLEHDNLLWSPDYPGYTRDAIEAAVGGTAVFIQGCAGDINPVFASHTPEDAYLAGASLAGPIIQAVAWSVRARQGLGYINLSWNRVEPAVSPIVFPDLAGGQIRTANRTVSLELAPVPAVEQANQSLARTKAEWLACDDGPTKDRLGASLAYAWAQNFHAQGQMLLEMIEPVQNRHNLDLTVKGMAVGSDLVIVALPGENFYEQGARLRQAASDCLVLVVGYANCSCGYLVPSSEYDDSGYEVGASYVCQGGAEVVCQAGQDLVTQLLSTGTKGES